MDLEKIPQKFVITFDCEWAPDFILEDIFGLLEKYQVKSTWFVTNKSDFLKNKNKLIEFGIHPNFFPNSSHGDNFESVMKFCKKIVPESKSVRTHRLLQSTIILNRFHEFGIKNDVSILLEGTPNIKPFYSKSFKLNRFPFFWEDDLQLNEKFSWHFNEDYFFTEGLKIFNFHPILIYLNSNNLIKYQKMMKEIGLDKININNIKQYYNNNKGERTFFLEILEFLKNNETNTINELSKKIEVLL